MFHTNLHTGRSSTQSDICVILLVYKESNNVLYNSPASDRHQAYIRQYFNAHLYSAFGLYTCA